MRIVLVVPVMMLLLSLPAQADMDRIDQRTHVTCKSNDSSARARFADYDGPEKANRVRAWFSQWLFGDNRNKTRSKVEFLWKPKSGDTPPSIRIITNEKPHNLIQLRSRTKESLIVVSSASSPMTTESWTFVLNFNLQTVIATRVQSNLSGVRGEVLDYDCTFRDLTPVIEQNGSGSPIG